MTTKVEAQAAAQAQAQALAQAHARDATDAKAKDHKQYLAVTNAPPIYHDVSELSPYFGQFGGCFIAETLIKANHDLAQEYVRATQDPEFRAELEQLGRDYIGRPTPLYFAERLTEHCGGAQVWLKREDLAHTGAHKINNALGQALLAKRLGKHRIIAETGAGQHGVATATACALLGLECIVYMGYVDTQRQSLNVFRMKMLGAKVVAVKSGSQTLKEAVNVAIQDWVENVDTTHYILGSAVGPHPFPSIVRDFQSVIGREAKAQLQDQRSCLPDALVACVGGGSNAIGLFADFLEDNSVQIYGVEGAGDGVDTDKNAATLTLGRPGLFHGTKTYLLMDDQDHVLDTHSISAGLDYAGVGPQHSFLKDSGRVTYVPCTDVQALDAFQLLSKYEGIIPALESSHAVWYGIELAKQMQPDQIVLVNVSGRGDKDMLQVAEKLGVNLNDDLTE